MASIRNNLTCQAIVTKYHSPTDTRGGRISATAAAGRVFVEYDHALNTERNHAAAALKLAEKMEWTGDMVQGGMPDGGYAFVFVE